MEAEPTITAICNVVNAVSSVLLTSDATGQQLKVFLGMLEALNQSNLPDGPTRDAMKAATSLQRAMLGQLGR